MIVNIVSLIFFFQEMYNSIILFNNDNDLNKAHWMIHNIQELHWRWVFVYAGSSRLVMNTDESEFSFVISVSSADVETTHELPFSSFFWWQLRVRLGSVRLVVSRSVRWQIRLEYSNANYSLKNWVSILIKILVQVISFLFHLR